MIFNIRTNFRFSIQWIVCLFMLSAATGSLSCMEQHHAHKTLSNNEAVSFSSLEASEISNRFGLKFTRLAAKDQPEQNLFFSPPGVVWALSITYNGANGKTSEAIADVLGFNPYTHEEINRAHKNLMKRIEATDTGVVLSVANSVWVDEPFSFQTDFSQQMSIFYDAKLKTLEFQNPHAPTTINNWVRDKTRGKISRVIGPGLSRLTLFLINTVYFKGKWSRPFDPKKTHQRPFHLPNGTTVQHPMMVNHGTFQHYVGEHFQSARLPYGGAGRFGMYVFLPDSDSSLHEFRQLLSHESLQQWMGAYQPTNGTIMLPRFQFSRDMDLVPVLSRLGLGILFDPNRANLRKMIDNPGGKESPLFVSRARQTSFVEVNEEGTEAAAATSFGMKITSAQKSFRLVLDRPFIFMIIDRKTGLILFAGQVINPSQL